ncbi:MAG TPA: NUDIX hydrolase, partial [Mycobacteriales bacterium]|nr:NUDIX hydrolase [Mycobacteriales bacterium]
MADGPIRAAGAVLWRPGPDGIEVAVVHRPKYDDWSLPKGKLERDELEVVAAVREVQEETGCSTAVGRSLGTTRYDVVQHGVRRPKTVRWWAMRATGGRFTPTREVDQLRWLPAAEAASALTRRQEREPLERLLSGPVETRTLMLVRHATAGDKSQWRGDDAQRPLDDHGRAQARAAADVLRLYRPERLLSAPLLRCTDTLTPLAAVSALTVEPADRLAAQRWTDDPDDVTAWLRQVVAERRSTVACSQGEVIPGLVQRLAGDLAPDGEVPAGKGSVWVLSFDDDGR